jgi:hypothetical protein
LLRRIWNRWKPIAQVIGDFQARIILTLFYFIFVTPFGVVVRFLSDPLQLKRVSNASLWKVRQPLEPNLDDARRQY